MNNGLREINELIGAWGGLICNNQGEIILSAVPPGMNKTSLEKISHQAVEMMSAAGQAVQGLSEAVLHYSEKKIFIVDLEKAILLVICTPSIDISLLRMTVNVVRANWEGDAKVQKQFQESFVERI